MENIVRDNRNYKASHYRRKILPLITFGFLLVILGQQVFFSHTVQATHIDQELSGRLRQRELAQQRIQAEKRKKSKKSKSRKNGGSSQKSSKAESKIQASQQQDSVQQQAAQQDGQAQAAQDSHQEQQQQQVQEQVEQVQQQQPQQQLQQQSQSQQSMQQQQEQAQAVADAASTPENAEPVDESRFKPKTQAKFVPSTERAHRSSLQLPDISVTGEEVHQETVDEISKASQVDIDAYSQVIALDDEAQAKFLQAMEPKPVNAEEDTGGMAQFMLDVGKQSQSLEGSEKHEEEVLVEPQPQDDTPETGADFAAELAQKYEAQQKEREAGRGVAEKIANSWYQNDNDQVQAPPKPSPHVERQTVNVQAAVQQQQYQEESDPINQEQIELDY